ncbi:MAG: cobalamin-dependent protein [Melioribacteraceae bacterium]|nr:cobalamin-dependent protein [Melioribacteraceae bacterium]
MNNQELIENIVTCVARGKVSLESPFPKDLIGQIGTNELTKIALENNISPDLILKACNDGMKIIGERFGKGEAFVPELLMSAKAMNAVMIHLKPFFKSGTVKSKGKFIIGTVLGDLHDIGKNLVSMVVEGNGWEVIDLGVDCKTEKFISKIKENPGCFVGLSALLTTTMANMNKTVQEIKKQFPEIKILVGGAPLTMEAAIQMGADGYSPNPQGAVEYLNSWV